MLAELKRQVYEANMDLVKQNLVIYTWGNVSGIDREQNLVVIKPSGVDYDAMQPEDMVVVDLDGHVVEGTMRPSSDTPIHLALYRAFKTLGGVVHTHSQWATTFSQSQKAVPCYGTTHADYFYGDVPCTRVLTETEILGDYELNTGLLIIETLHKKKLDPKQMPGILVANHGPFTFGDSPKKAVHNAKVLEEICKMAYYTNKHNTNCEPISQVLLDKHYLRKHGAGAYYGQK